MFLKIFIVTKIDRSRLRTGLYQKSHARAYLNRRHNSQNRPEMSLGSVSWSGVLPLSPKNVQFKKWNQSSRRHILWILLFSYFLAFTEKRLHYSVLKLLNTYTNTAFERAKGDILSTQQSWACEKKFYIATTYEKTC